MGITDFIKNLFKQEEIKIVQIEFSNLNNFIQNKEQENKIKEQEFINSTNQLTIQLTEDLRPKIQILENIDLTEKKVEEKIRLIIKQNLDNYTNHLKKLITNLQNINTNNPQSLINQINSIFKNFQKNSNTSFQKSTFLIGKELENITDTLINFSKNFKNLQQENKELILTNQILNHVKSNLNNYRKIKETQDSINNNLINLKNQSTNLKSKVILLKKEIEEIKQNNEYKEESKKEQDINNKKQELKKTFQALKQLIDFKTLANIFHSNEKEMNIIKKHKENFQQAFEKDNQIILNLLSDAKLNTKAISEKAEQINMLQQNINKKGQNLELKQHALITIKQSEIEKLNSEIQNLASQQSKENKRFKKMQTNLQEIKNIIKQQLVKINVELV